MFVCSATPVTCTLSSQLDLQGSTHFLALSIGTCSSNLYIGRVFYKDGGSSQKQTFHGCRIIDAAPSSDSGQKTPMLHSAFFLERGTEGIANGTKTSTKSKESSQANPIVSTGTSNEGTNQMIATNKEILKEIDVTGSGENEHRDFDNCKLPTEGGSQLGGSNFINDGNKNGLEERDAVRVHVEPAKANGSLPIWTDEQLNELFDDDLQDDMLF
ncbi:hypothetical protein L6452_08400 [Arctium lappa]|uniref:Uncharacterized protein n=1 Tax=Arctium lappa TaxID=4217 RepID=A0ACB9DHL2_ARCLA|nr:hypothetical protein L6452_08400 [Arctium lappa]